MDFVTLATFSTSYDATPYKVNLEHEGIPCFLKDEHTVTAARIYEHAVGGIKLQVPKEDFQRAKQIMKDAGYVFDDIFDLPPFWKWFDRNTRTFPLIGSMNIVFRFVIFLVLLSLVVIYAIYQIYPSFNH